MTEDCRLWVIVYHDPLPLMPPTLGPAWAEHEVIKATPGRIILKAPLWRIERALRPWPRWRIVGHPQDD